MDPDKNLADQGELKAKIRKMEARHREMTPTSNAAHVLRQDILGLQSKHDDLVIALHRWVSRGGFRPKAWMSRRTP